MPAILRRFSLALALLLLLGAAPAAAAPGWTAHITLSPDLLAMWQIRVEADSDGTLAEARHPDYPGHRTLVLRGAAGDRPDAAQLDGSLVLWRGKHRLRLEALRLRVAPDLNAVFLDDAKGRALLTGEMPHRQPTPGLDWRYMNLRLLPRAAAALGAPVLADVVLGVLDLRGPQALEPKGLVNCRSTVSWPSPTEPADIALIDIPGVQAFACRVCSNGSCVNTCTAGGSDGEVVIAPDATLLNVGDRDVPWYPKFFPAQPPYGNDQHPYLVWALYRLDADGAVVPLGSSGLKHAFFAQNDMCNCFGDRVLYRGCSDLYSASTNNAASLLGPREEVAPRSGLWGRCGSVFDPDCDGLENTSGYAFDNFSRRLVAREADLLPTRHPDARWFIEAWYVTRDDGNLDNSFAHREVVPTKTGSGWTFPLQGALRSGPLLHRWVDPATPGPMQRSSRVDHGNGRVQLAVQVEAARGGYRYRYALLNLDFAEASFEGSAAALRLLQQRGVGGLSLPLPPGALSGGVRLRDDDHDSGNDWSAAIGPTLSLQATQAEGLGWGRLLTVSYCSPLPPAEVTATLQLGSSSTTVQTLAPSASGLLRDGFESC